MALRQKSAQTGWCERARADREIRVGHGGRVGVRKDWPYSRSRDFGRERASTVRYRLVDCLMRWEWGVSALSSGWWGPSTLRISPPGGPVCADFL